MYPRVALKSVPLASTIGVPGLQHSNTTLSSQPSLKNQSLSTPPSILFTINEMLDKPPILKKQIWEYVIPINYESLEHGCDRRRRQLLVLNMASECLWGGWKTHGGSEGTWGIFRGHSVSRKKWEKSSPMGRCFLKIWFTKSGGKMAEERCCSDNGETSDVAKKMVLMNRARPLPRGQPVAWADIAAPKLGEGDYRAMIQRQGYELNSNTQRGSGWPALKMGRCATIWNSWGPHSTCPV